VRRPLECASRRPLAHRNASPSYCPPPPLFPSVTPVPSSLLSAAHLRPGASTDATLAVVAVHGLAVGARPSSASQLVPSALVRPTADLLSDARGQPRRPVPTTVGSSNKCGPPAVPKPSETSCDEPPRALQTSRDCGSDLTGWYTQVCASNSQQRPRRMCMWVRTAPSMERHLSRDFLWCECVFRGGSAWL